MKRLNAALVVVGAIVLTMFGAQAASRPAHAVAPGGASAPGKDGVGGKEKPLPPFVQKWQNERAAAADLVARGEAAPDANGVVTLKNGKYVRYKLQGTEYLTTALVDFTDVQHGQI